MTDKLDDLDDFDSDIIRKLKIEPIELDTDNNEEIIDTFEDSLIKNCKKSIFTSEIIADINIQKQKNDLYKLDITKIHSFTFNNTSKNYNNFNWFDFIVRNYQKNIEPEVEITLNGTNLNILAKIVSYDSRNISLVFSMKGALKTGETVQAKLVISDMLLSIIIIRFYFN